MFDRLAVAAVGGACVLAAGTGAFVATRMNPAPAAGTAVSEPERRPTPAVQETEAIVEAPREDGAPSARLQPIAREEATAPAARPRPRQRPAAQAPVPNARRTRPAGPSVPQPPPAPAPEPASGAVVAEQFPATRSVDLREPPPPPQPVYDELVIEADSVVGLRLENTVSSETARVEDQVEARVTRDVMVGSRVALPTGSRAIGHVTMVEQGGKVKERARLGVRFHTLVLADGTTLPMQTETIFREGDSPAAASSAKIGGGAIGGAVIGAILGGTKGAVIGGSAGAGAGTAAVMAASRRPATLQGGSTLTVRVLSPVTVTVER